MKKIYLLITSLFLITLTSCGASNIGEEVQKVMDEATSIEVNEIIECNISQYDKKNNTTETITLTETHDITRVQKDENCDIYKNSGEININIFEKKYTYETLTFGELTKNQLTVYDFNEDDNTWSKEIDNSINIDKNKNEYKFDELIDLLSLTNKSIDMNNQKCYEYHGFLNYYEWASTTTLYTNELNLSLEDNIKNINDLKINVWIYINKETYEPVKMVIEMCNEKNPVILNISDNSIECKIDLYKFTYNYKSFNEVESIAMPAEINQ